MQVGWTRIDVEVAPHVRIAAFATGRAPADAPTLLFVHGLGHWTQAAWDPLAGHLSDDFRIVAFDLPGFGASSKPDARYDLGFFTETLAAVVERFELRRFTLVGHSLGGLIAASYAAQRPERVELLALIDPAGFRRTARLLFHVAASRPAAWFFGMRPSRRFVRRTFARATVDPECIPEAIHEQAFRLARDPAFLRAFARVYSGALGDWLRLRGLHERLGRYRGPVLLFWGRQDRYVPIRALAHARRVYPQAKVTVLERSAHLPNVEEPAAVADRIRAALLPFAERAAGAPNRSP
jgi:abhydrolase domain-containing protein 6